jgi:hypothetical protein
MERSKNVGNTPHNQCFLNIKKVARHLLASSDKAQPSCAPSSAEPEKASFQEHRCVTFWSAKCTFMLL